MAAIAYPLERVPTGRSGPVDGRRRRIARKGGSHLRLVEAPLFSEPIFEQLKEESKALTAEWSVWHRPVPVIPRHQIITNYLPFERPESNPTPLRQLVLTTEPMTQYECVAQPGSPARSVGAPHYRLRRLVACIALGFVIFGGLSGASALAGAHQGSPAVLAGSFRVPGGYEYTVHLGDTLWSIASRVYPNGDPRVLVTQLEAQLHGATPTPGTRLQLP
jgi:hypothetical protein